MTVEYVATEQNFSLYSMNAELKYGDKITHISLKLIEIFTHFKNFAIDLFSIALRFVETSLYSEFFINVFNMGIGIK